MEFELERTTQIYAAVLRQLLPTGGYDNSPNTNIADDIYAHAKVLAQCDLNAQRLLNVLESIPPELLEEYEREYGLPLKCQTNVNQSFEERLSIVRWIRSTRNVFNKTYLEQLLALFGVTLIELKTYQPLKCTAPCNFPVNTDQLRFKVQLKIGNPLTADMECIIKNYLPAFLRYDLEFIV